ncbi:O-acetyl-ADP-ribose deacetylase [Kangiella taiwanensis]|uniref:O-acetyl-ADP-ribose deacetylase n=1 Tax=Kangiella taiwanensis TaxID=1079179 RepID=A0ABP8I7J4_9GAMM|nr:O-acetyl-ADP-ribose deacetylase [Kangiella taiwanensis]
MLKLDAGDITHLAVDAIVNAANKSLLGGGGVDGAIHRAAGPELLEACKKLNGCETGQAKVTQGYNLPARFVIHTVGPVWKGGDHGEAELLKSCYQESLKLAVEHDIRSIAFPCISTGVYRYPKQEAASIAVSSCKNFLQSRGVELDITFCCFGDDDLDIYRQLLNS